MIKHITIALGAATLSLIPAIAHAQEVYPPEVGVRPPTVNPVQQPAPPPVPQPAPVVPTRGSLPGSGSDGTTMLLQVGSLLLVAGGAAVVATHRRRGATAPA